MQHKHKQKILRAAKARRIIYTSARLRFRNISKRTIPVRRHGVMPSCRHQNW